MSMYSYTRVSTGMQTNLNDGVNMKKINESITELVGNTPVLHLRAMEEKTGACARVYAKLEYLNPAGSAKERVAAQMIADAEREGKIKPGDTLIESTSGNTGIGLAAIGARLGYNVVLTMPDTMSAERRQLLAAYGARIVLTPGELGMNGAIAEAERLCQQTPGGFIPSQFTNPSNPKAHELTTGPEIWEQTDGDIDIFVAGVGTGGTLTGTGRYLRSKNNGIKLVAVEPDTSAVLSGKKPGKHGLQGIGAGFIPEILDVSLIDEVIPVALDDAYKYGRMIGVSEGILVGISSGAALCAAFELACRSENEGKSIVVLLPDTGDRYLSTDMYS